MDREGPSEAELSQRRRRMVEQQLRQRGIADPRVLAAMAEVPRHRFVAPAQWEEAYEDYPLSIGQGQTISQPFMVARMTELCGPQPGDRALEVGAGSGYQTAVLARLCDLVYALEYVEDLAKRCAALLTDLGVVNALVAHGDGSDGWSEEAPFDVILVAAGAPDVPQPLLAQLAEGGRLVIPVGDRYTQVLRLYRREEGRIHYSEHTVCRFVTLMGRFGWED